MRLKRWEIALLASLLAVFLVCAFPLQAQSKLADKLTRLHVLANSDSVEDQTLKLQVRDAVLAASEGEAVLNDALLDKLERAAQAEVNRRGYAYPVRVTRENCYFDTRVYETFSLPAGGHRRGRGEKLVVRDLSTAVHRNVCAGLGNGSTGSRTDRERDRADL